MPRANSIAEEANSIRGIFDEETSQDGVNRSRCATRGLHCELSNYNAEPQAERNRFYEKGTIFGFRCPCGDDCGSDGRARGRGSMVGDHSESRRVDSQTGEEVGAGRATAGLL